MKINPENMKQYEKIQERVYNIKDLDFRAVQEGDDKVLEGYAALYNTRSKLLYNRFYEVIDRGAFDDLLQSKDLDVVLNFNHDNSLVMGRTINGTLSLSSDEKGLFFRAVLPDTSYANDVYKLVQRGDIFQNSFAFLPADDGYTVKRDTESDYDLITVSKIDRLRDVSAVTFPAYAETELVARQEVDPETGEPIPMVEISQDKLDMILSLVSQLTELTDGLKVEEEPEEEPDEPDEEEPIDDVPTEDEEEQMEEGRSTTSIKPKRLKLLKL